MATIMLRALPADLVGRLKTYARDRSLSLTTAAVELLTAALDHREARQRGAAKRWAELSADERRVAATLASHARHRPDT